MIGSLKASLDGGEIFLWRLQLAIASPKACEIRRRSVRPESIWRTFQKGCITQVDDSFEHNSIIRLIVCLN